MRNYTEIPVQLPDALSASFHEVPAVGQFSQKPSHSPNNPEIAPPDDAECIDTQQRLGSSVPRTLLDQIKAPLYPLAAQLCRATLIFGGPAGLRQKVEQIQTQDQAHMPSP
jgi:hypothetical protein